MSKDNLIIHSTFKDYSVNIVNDTAFIDELCDHTNTQFVIDKNVFELYSSLWTKIPADRLSVIEADENSKVIDTALEICEKMTEISAKKNARIISIGGGIIQDITGFVANILYRGIRWIFVPTTLLSACDSCIGGKTSLNYKKFKNLLGTFYPPDQIYICPSFFQTLSQKDFESGLGEVVKFNIMAGKDGLTEIEESIHKLIERNETTLNNCVRKSLQFKKHFIEIDEFDKGERIKLNFAHTFGHAIETVTEYVIPHGTAVAIGMIMANRISVKRNLLDPEFAGRSECVLLKIIHISADFRTVDHNKLMEAIRKDKKQVDDQITAVLMTNVAGDIRVVHDIKEYEIRDAINHFIDIYY